MRTVLQRVKRARVVIAGQEIAGIAEGLVALVAIARDDSQKDLEWMAKKILQLRIFDDQAGRMNHSLADIGGQILIVSQFTLYGDCRKGRRPSYSEAAAPSRAEILYEDFVQIIKKSRPEAQTGRFQADMEVEIVNSGPVTLIIDSPRQ
jgi:D-tyrosyl-tRNA(Tyr) deacylase